MAFSTALNKVIELLHSEAGDPNELLYFNARDDAELKALSPQLAPILTAKHDALEQLIKNNNTSEVKVSAKTVQFWETKWFATKAILEVVQQGSKPSGELSAGDKAKRDEYFITARTAWTNVREVFLQLHKEIIGPYVLGAALSRIR